MCAANGSGYLPCQCADAGTGGSSGSGGSSGTGVGGSSGGAGTSSGGSGASGGSGGAGGDASAGDGSGGTAGSAGDAGSPTNDAGDGAAGDAADAGDAGGSTGCSSVSGCWVTETVGAASGPFTRVALDPQGKAHVLAWGSPSTVYATNKSGTWVSVAAPAGAKDLAVDSSGGVHVCSATDSELTHSVRTTTGWTTEVARRAGDPISANEDFMAFAYCTIAVQAAPQIAFKARGVSTGTGLYWFYVGKVGSAWSDLFVSGVHVEGFGNGEIAATPAGAWHLAQRVGVLGGTLRYTVSGTAVATLVDYQGPPNYGEISADPDIALDSSANPHFAYSAWYVTPPAQTSDYWVYYAQRTAGAFQRERASCTSTSSNTALALAGTTPHIAFQRASDAQVIYATKTPSGWTNEDLGASGGPPGVAVDGSGKPHVAYVNSSGSLILKRRCP